MTKSVKSVKRVVSKKSAVLPAKKGSNSKRTDATIKPVENNKNSPFFIVGIGASAGGLEALELFLGRVPVNSGMAYVIIQHLDPTHKGMMPELLQRATSMPVAQAKNRMKIKPDCVYVIPPKWDLSVLHGTLYLLEPVAPRGQRLPIDYFLRSLAQDQRELGIAVILSGMGSDGTLGVRAIKENAGLVLVQDPESAKFDSMPRSVIDAGLADIIASAEDLPGKIVDYVRHARPSIIEPKPLSSTQKGALDKIFILLRERTGHDFSLYKKNTIDRRIERRMNLHQLTRIADYVRYLRENPQEIDLLFKELLIGVTSFFRDASAWEHLQEHALPQLLNANPKGKQMRAWVAGCSSGEEAYTLAMVFLETLEQVKTKARYTLQIFATDLDADAIDKAREGYYPANIAADISAKRLARFFSEEGNGFRVRKEIREMVIFAPQNIIMDPPFTKLEILSCRNLMIYLGPELQKKLLPLFHYCLNPGGILFLGSSESTGSFNHLFSPLELKSRLYGRNESPVRSEAMEFPSNLVSIQHKLHEAPAMLPSADNLQAAADQLLLQKFSPAAVLVNKEGDILYISGRTGNYLEPAAGKANWNIHAMAREGLRHELALMLPKALREKDSISHAGIRLENNGLIHTVNLTVQAIEHPQSLNGMAMVVFNDMPVLHKEHSESARRSPARGRMADMEQALQQAHEEAQTVREEMQTQQEELRSTNEELQSTIEELQSTNEELTTSKEEMQSLNEELQTVNIELQTKVDALSSVNSDMKNLLNSTDIATVFLDNALNVRRYTEHAQKIFKLIPGDVGRPLSDISSDLDYPGIEKDIQEVLRSLIFSGKEIATRDGRWYMVKIMPYRTLENLIDGVVITLTDTSVAKRLEAELRRTQIKGGHGTP
ncbi:MAG: chemotaxis protein CheB [Gallionella sp.]